MNITDVTERDIREVQNKFNHSDTFSFFMNIGKEYMKKYRTEPIDINTREGQKEFRRISCYMVEELMEMQNCLKIREWSKYEYPVDEQHFMEELVDSFNFMIQIILLLDLDTHKFRELVSKKYVINSFREKSQY